MFVPIKWLAQQGIWVILIFHNGKAVDPPKVKLSWIPFSAEIGVRYTLKQKIGKLFYYTILFSTIAHDYLSSLWINGW